MKKVVWKNTCIEEEKFVAGPEDFSLQCTTVNNTYTKMIWSHICLCLCSREKIHYCSDDR